MGRKIRSNIPYFQDVLYHGTGDLDSDANRAYYATLLGALLSLICAPFARGQPAA
jgi:hypothetical protein